MPSFVVRMEILTQLYKYNDENLKSVLKIAISDPYELIRRTAASMIGDCGDDELIEPLLSVIFDDKYSKKIRSNATNSFNFMDPDALIKSLPEIAKKYSYIEYSSTVRDELLGRAGRNKETIKGNFEVVASDSSLTKYQLLEIRTLRNYYYHYAIPDYLKLMTDPDSDSNLRVALIEAMGWFTHSKYKNEIINACKEIASKENFSEESRYEADRTINRLNAFKPNAKN